MLGLGSNRQGNPSIIKRVVFFALITWLPLLMLSAVQGLALSNAVKISFLRDIGAYGRFLAAIARKIRVISTFVYIVSNSYEPTLRVASSIREK